MICYSYLGLTNFPATCAFGKPFSVDHSLHCSFGDFPTIRHNELHDVTADLLSQVCSNVATNLNHTFNHFQVKPFLIIQQMQMTKQNWISLLRVSVTLHEWPF